MASDSANSVSLEELDDEELARLEDRLLMEREIDWTFRSGASAGRIVIVILFVALFLILKAAATRLLGGMDLGVVLFIASYLLLLGVAIVGAWAIWRSIGRPGRRVLRLALHYWPLTLYILALLAGTVPH